MHSTGWPQVTENPSPVKLEWVGTDGNNLSVNGKLLGSIDYSKNNGGWYIMTWAPLESDLSKGGYMPLETARANLEGAARAWLSPITNEPVGVTDESAWLIEQKGPTSYFCAGKNGFHWSKDANEAVRFSRKQDAEGFADWCHIEMFVECATTEHMWTSLSAAIGERG